MRNFTVINIKGNLVINLEKIILISELWQNIGNSYGCQAPCIVILQVWDYISWIFSF